MAHLDDFVSDLLVECPRCHRCAHLAYVELPADDGYRLSCLRCGHAHDWLAGSAGGYRYPTSGPELEWFGVSLWLRAPCCGEVLWAYNAAHLAFLETFVGAKLRGRRRHPWGWSNKSLESRLPAWMKAATNRSAVLEAIEKLRAKLIDA